MNNRSKNWARLSWHPSDEELLAFLDGESSAKQASKTQKHLEGCWDCRARRERTERSISAFINYRHTALADTTEASSRAQGRFADKLDRLAAEQTEQPQLFHRYGAQARHFFLFRPAVLATAVVLLAIGLGVRFSLDRQVSASELLRRAAQAEADQLNHVSNPVVHRKFQVRRRSSVTVPEQVVNWEIWNDTKNSRVRQFFTDRNQSIADELARVLQANHMDAARPLSAASYQSWHNTLQHPRDEVTKSKLADGNDVLTLRTISASPVNTGQIAEAAFVVRTSDWQPTELRLNLAAEDGNRIYELTATLSEVVTLAQVEPALFASQPVVPPSPSRSPKEVAKKETQPAPALASNAQPLNAPPVASADLEVEVLRLLNQATADLGEQITVKRQSDGLLHIAGIVETDKRKMEILTALSSISGNPAVRIELQTVAEAVAKQTSNKPTPTPSTRAVEITSNTMAAEPELRSYFASKGKDTDEAIREYAARIVRLSNRAMDHLWAMKRLLNQFSPEEARALTPEARSKWIGLIRSHCRSYQAEIESMCRELQPIFFPSQSLGQSLGMTSQVSPITDANELTQTVNQLFELGSSNDRVIRSAFTSSSGAVMTTVIKTPQFWQSLKNAEGLASRIARSQ
jgi:anti-sigma factor RsiW